jgi:hypothetical protein
MEKGNSEPIEETNGTTNKEQTEDTLEPQSKSPEIPSGLTEEQLKDSVETHPDAIEESTDLADKKPNHAAVATSEETATEDETSSPTLIVEKVDSEPRHSDDFGASATVGQKDAHHLHSQDTEPDVVVVRSNAPTPELADIAAEVADSAATLDRDQPTPPISDEEAGRIGFRRMSSTPIPEVAKTAADVAAGLNEEKVVGFTFTRSFNIF